MRIVKSKTEQEFKDALKDKKVPILTLDSKWHHLFTDDTKPDSMKNLEKELNGLIRKQGQLNNDIKEYKKLKTKLMTDIVENMEGSEESFSNQNIKKLEENQKMIKEINDKINDMDDQLLDLPKTIKEVNEKLMIISMDICYSRLKENESYIKEVADWIKQIRIELKKNIIRKQDKEIMNQAIYSYMHDILGARVVDVFDIQYDYEKKEVTSTPKKTAETE